MYKPYRGSAGTDIGFALADKLRLNYYDAEIFKDLVIRKDAEKDARWKSKKIDLSHEMINPEKARRFSRNHGLPANDAAFFNESEILRNLLRKRTLLLSDVVLTLFLRITIYLTSVYLLLHLYSREQDVLWNLRKFHILRH